MTRDQTNENKPDLRAVVFDLDGILANTEDLYEKAGETVLGRRGKTYDAELRERIMGRPVVDAIQIMIDCHSLPDTVDDLMRECADVLQHLMATSLAPMPGALSLIDDLQSANIPIAVATSATPEYADNVLTRLRSQAAVPVYPHRRRHPSRQTRSGNLFALRRPTGHRGVANDGLRR